MKINNLFVILITILLSSSCATLQPVTVVKNDSMMKYKYIYISDTKSLTSSSGTTINGQYYSSSKSVNPKDVIIGLLIKRGYIILPELKERLSSQTLIVNYGESGKRNVAGGLLGYTIEVTIQFISAKSQKLVCSCTAEGQGSTEADDIRQAITRCLSGAFKN